MNRAHAEDYSIHYIVKAGSFAHDAAELNDVLKERLKQASIPAEQSETLGAYSQGLASAAEKLKDKCVKAEKLRPSGNSNDKAVAQAATVAAVSGLSHKLDEIHRYASTREQQTSRPLKPVTEQITDLFAQHRTLLEDTSAALSEKAHVFHRPVAAAALLAAQMGANVSTVALSAQMMFGFHAYAGGEKSEPDGAVWEPKSREPVDVNATAAEVGTLLALAGVANVMGACALRKRESGQLQETINRHLREANLPVVVAAPETEAVTVTSVSGASPKGRQR